jgi:hypothetical protein
VRIPIPNGMIAAAALFGRDSYFAVRDDEVIIGDAIDPEYHVLSAKGRLERTVRADYDLSLDPELLEAERLARLGESPEPDALRLLDQLPVPKRRPAYGVIPGGRHRRRLARGAPRSSRSAGFEKFRALGGLGGDGQNAGLA